MGVNDRVRDEKDKRVRAAEEKRKLRDRPGKGGEVADWGGCDCALMARFVAVAARDGGAVRFGYTRDGGAYAVGIYGDGTPYTVYVSPKEDINEWLKSAIEDFQ